MEDVQKLLGKGCVSTPNIPILNNVFLVEGITANLMSVSQLCDEYENICLV